MTQNVVRLQKNVYCCSDMVKSSALCMCIEIRVVVVVLPSRSIKNVVVIAEIVVK